MSKFDTPMFFLPDDLIRLCTTFLWDSGGITASELRRDIVFYEKWHRKVPQIFLNCSVLETDLWMHVPNPMRKGYPYWPRKRLLLRPKTVWSDAMFTLGSRLCRERIREVRTYKRCALRWIQNCISSLHLECFDEVEEKLFHRIKEQHFRRRSNLRFVRECLQQLSFLRHASVCGSALPSPSAR